MIDVRINDEMNTFFENYKAKMDTTLNESVSDNNVNAEIVDLITAAVVKEHENFVNGDNLIFLPEGISNESFLILNEMINEDMADEASYDKYLSDWENSILEDCE